MGVEFYFLRRNQLIVDLELNKRISLSSLRHKFLCNFRDQSLYGFKNLAKLDLRTTFLEKSQHLG